jgi:hypothetical protein
MTSRTHESRPATQKQLRYLRSLVKQTATTFASPTSSVQASREIERLRALKASRGRIRDTPAGAERLPLYATAAQPDEIRGYGSDAHWRTTTPREPEVPGEPSVGPRTELARYSVSSGERVVYGQRISGSVRLTDAPSEGTGRAYVIERELERDGRAAMEALVEDYLEQASELDAVPMFSKRRR